MATSLCVFRDHFPGTPVLGKDCMPIFSCLAKCTSVASRPCQQAALHRRVPLRRAVPWCAAKCSTEGYFDAFHVVTMSVSLAVRLSSAPLRALACCILGIVAGKVALRARARPLSVRIQDVANAATAVLIAWCSFPTFPCLDQANPWSLTRAQC